jgi:hypothetical protein
MSSKHSAKQGNRPPKGEPWIWLTREMLSSPAWRALTPAALKVVKRVMLEHMAHAFTANGNLVVTYSDFREYGVRNRTVRTAIAIAEALGWLDVTVRGKASFEDQRYPSRYALTWLPQPGSGKPASNRWRGIKTDQAAQAVVKDALTRREAERDERAARRRKGQTRKPRLKAVA